jgi:hypothetical protein
LAALLLGLTGLLLAPLHLRRRSPPAAAGGAARSKPQPAERRPPAPLSPRPFAALAVGALALLVLLDQHRFQPWAYQFAVAALVLAFTPPVEAAALLRVLTVAIYFWSSVSKFDYTFLHSTGTLMLDGLFRALQLYPYTIDTRTAVLLAWVLPLDELAVAILLAVRRTRTVGLVASILMHLLLLAALGPLGLNHEPGVLLWNAYFIVQNLLLFRRPPAGWRRTAGPGALLRLREIASGLIPPSRSSGLGRAAVYAAIWLPALEPFGLLDHWPAWAVYSPSIERVALVIPFEDDQRHGFDEWEGHYFAIDSFGAPWRLMDDLWSLETLHAPVYPQGRFHAGVALAAVERHKLQDVATLTVWSRADRLTGRRTRTEYAGEDAIRRYAESFRLNALPRTFWAE